MTEGNKIRFTRMFGAAVGVGIPALWQYGASMSAAAVVAAVVAASAIELPEWFVSPRWSRRDRMMVASLAVTLAMLGFAMFVAPTPPSGIRFDYRLVIVAFVFMAALAQLIAIVVSAIRTPFRFSFREMLIVMTATAVLLGFGVWLLS